MRIGRSVSQREGRQLVLGNFCGADFSSSPLSVSPQRASDMCNLINDNGVNHKRPGWKEHFRIKVANCICKKTKCECSQINGIYYYENGTFSAIIVYAGRTFYEYGLDGSLKQKLYSSSSFINGRVQFYRLGDAVYIIGCGDYLVYGLFDGVYKIKRVTDIAYIPTTSASGKPRLEELTQSTNPDDYVSEYELFEVESKGAFLENVNILTRKRKNTFIGVYPKGTLGLIKYTYYTDSPFLPESAKIIVEHSGGTTDTYTQNSKEISFNTGGNGLADSFTTSMSFAYNGSYISDYANVTIEFEASGGDDVSSEVTGCRFGALFGASGGSDRLFLSGNPKYPNVDFYSEFNDYSYFSSSGKTVMGSDDVAISGYIRLSDNTLATMKNGAIQEPSVYYRQATEVTSSVDDEVNNIVFTKWAGGVGEACINPYVVAHLAEDSLILSENGVFGITDVVSLTNSRYMRERSRFINEKLLKEPLLSSSSAVVYQNRYYLAVPTLDERNGAVYVADPRFKTYRGDDIDNSFNYDWWCWENVPARVFANIDGELWFGDGDGRVCCFDGEFCDRTYERLGSGAFTVNDGCVVFGASYTDKVKECDGVILKGLKYKKHKDDTTVYVAGDDMFYISAFDESEHLFSVSKHKGGESLYLAVGNLNFEIVLCFEKNVRSLWSTPVFDLGSSSMQKTLSSLVATCDPKIKGEVTIRYRTRNTEGAMQNVGEKALDFEDFSFDNFSFSSEFTSAYKKRVKARNFGYIVFDFISDGKDDSAVASFTAEYTYTVKHKRRF